MKKILSAVAAFALAAALISCGGNSDEFDGKVDTVLTIGAPSVKAHAYPGVNYVTWDPVASADKYEIYRIGDGEATGTKLTEAAKCEYADVASTSNIIADGKTYKYVVIAVPENAANKGVQTPAQIPTRAIYMKANQGSASVKAYVPAAGTEITAFTDSYTKSFLKKYASSDVAALKKNGAEVKLVNLVNGGADLYATYPATAGFEFGVKFLNKTQPDYLYESKLPTSYSGVYVENYVNNATTPALDAGEYEAYLTVKSVCSFYPTTVTYTLGTYTVKALGETATETDQTKVKTSKFTDKENVTIRWQPSKSAVTGKFFDTANYAVYRTTGTGNDGSTYTKVDGTITAVQVAGDANSGTDVAVTNGTAGSGTAYITTQYQIVDKIGEAGNTGKYTYKIVLFAKDAEGNIEIGKTATATVNPFALDTTDAPNFVLANSDAGYNNLIGKTAAVSKDKDNLDNQIKIVAHVKNSKSQKLYLSYIKLDTAFTTSFNKTFAAFGAETEMKNNNDIRDDVFVEYIDTKKETGTYLFKLTAKETGKADYSVYTTVQVSTGDVATGTLSITAFGDAKAIVKDTAESADTVNKYKYQLVIVTVSNPVNKGGVSNNVYSDYVTVASEAKDITLAPKDIATGDATATSDYVLSGLTTNGTAANITYPFGFTTDVKADTASATGTTKVTKTWYVKKILVADESKYDFAASSVSFSWVK